MFPYSVIDWREDYDKSRKVFFFSTKGSLLVCMSLSVAAQLETLTRASQHCIDVTRELEQLEHNFRVAASSISLARSIPPDSRFATLPPIVFQKAIHTRNSLLRVQTFVALELIS